MPGKRLRSKDKTTACKLAKLNEHEEPVRVDPSSKFLKRAKTDPNVIKRRDRKSASKSRNDNHKSGKESVTSKFSRRSARLSGKSSPYRIEKVTHIKKSIPKVQTIKQVEIIPEAEWEKLEQELLMSKSDLSRTSNVSLPEMASEQPMTRSRKKDYVIRRHMELKQSPKVRLNYDESQNVSSPSPRSDRNNHFYSPIRDNVMTPMKIFAQRIQRRVRTTHFINSEHFSNAFMLGIVFLSIMVFSLNSISKTPLENYRITPGSELPHMGYDNGTYHCNKYAIKVHRLCAPADDHDYIHELALIEHDFEELIHSHDPCQDKVPQLVSRKLKDPKLFENIINNDYFKERMIYRLDNDTSVATMNLKKSFIVTPPLLNVIWCKSREYIENSQLCNTYFWIGALVISLIVSYTVYTLCKSANI